MSEQYDFEKQIPVIKESVVTEPKQYDFGENLKEFVNSAARVVNDVAKKGYWRNVFSGAGMGSAVGGVGGIVSNSLKSDSDPTKKSTFKSFVKGATKGAVAGGTIGLAGRALAGRSFSKMGIDTLNKTAVTNTLVNAAKEGQKIGLKGNELAKFIHDRAIKSNIGLDTTQIQNIINNIL